MSKLNLILLILLTSLSSAVHSEMLQKECEVRPFSDQNITEIIRRERLVRKDLPPPFDEQEVKVLRDGCYYLYQEWKKPKTPGVSNIFMLDQFGVIVDVTAQAH